MARTRKLHSENETLRQGIARCLAHVIDFSGTICRAVTTKYANSSDLLTGNGAKIHGGRWNPPGIFPAVYGSLDPYAALAETIGIYGDYQVPLDQRLPLVLVGIHVQLQQVFDVTDGNVRRRLGVSEKRMLDSDWQGIQAMGGEGLTQAIGRLAWEANCEAILVPSARFRNEKNLVIFPDRMRKSSFLKIINLKELPERR